MPNFGFNCDKYPADYCVNFYGSEVISVFNFVVGYLRVKRVVRNYMKLDFNQFPKMNNGYLIVPVPDYKLKQNNEIYSRFCSAIYFASSIGTNKSLHMISVEVVRTAYMRAFLAEFVSIEELLKVNFPSKSDKDKYCVSNLENPLFHFIKLLRNYNIHLSNSMLGDKTISVAIENMPEDVHEISTSYIDNLDIEEFKKLDAYKKKIYTENDISQMIKYFETEQHCFGVAHLLLRAIVDYSVIIGRFLTSRPS